MKYSEIKVAGTCKECGTKFDYGFPGETFSGMMAEDYTETEAAELYTLCRECANRKSAEQSANLS